METFVITPAVQVSSFHLLTVIKLFFFLRCLILQCETHPDLCESYAEDEKLQMKK